jgi:hypothetical protein
VPVDHAISTHIALMAAELALDEAPDLTSMASPSSLARPSAGILPASLKLPV